MSNNSLSNGGTPAVDSEALGEWVAETASQKGISERELLDEILSSYWVLEELSDVIVDSESDEQSAHSHPSDQPEAVGDQSRAPEPAQESPARHEPTAEPTPQTADASPDHPDQPHAAQPEDAETPEEDVEISRTFHYRASGEEAEKSDEELELSGIEQELEKLRTVIDELSGTESLLPTESTDGGERPDPTDDRAEATSEPTEITESTTQTADSWSNHSGAIAELDDELVEIRNQLAELETDLTERINTTAESQDELEAWIEDEFDNIEDVLQHLLSTTDNLEYRIGSVVDSHRERLEPLQQAHAEQEQLTAIKDEAIRKGVKSAECDSCEESVDLGVLPSPHCPNCDQQFTGVEGAAKWNPFSKATLRTTPSRRRETPPTAPSEPGSGTSHDQRPPAGDQRTDTPDFQQSQPPADADQDHRTDNDSNWG